MKDGYDAVSYLATASPQEKQQMMGKATGDFVKGAGNFLNDLGNLVLNHTALPVLNKITGKQNAPSTGPDLRTAEQKQYAQDSATYKAAVSDANSKYETLTALGNQLDILNKSLDDTDPAAVASFNKMVDDYHAKADDLKETVAKLPSEPNAPAFNPANFAGNLVGQSLGYIAGGEVLEPIMGALEKSSPLLKIVGKTILNASLPAILQQVTPPPEGQTRASVFLKGIPSDLLFGITSNIPGATNQAITTGLSQLGLGKIQGVPAGQNILNASILTIFGLVGSSAHPSGSASEGEGVSTLADLRQRATEIMNTPLGNKPDPKDVVVKAMAHEFLKSSEEDQQMFATQAKKLLQRVVDKYNAAKGNTSTQGGFVNPLALFGGKEEPTSPETGTSKNEPLSDEDISLHVNAAEAAARNVPIDQVAKEKAATKPTEIEPFSGFKDLTTTTLDKLKGRVTASKQFISDLTNAPDLKQNERDIVRTVLKDYPDGQPVPVKEFAEKVHTELLPLKVNSSDIYTPDGGSSHNPDAMVTEGNFTPKYENVALPPELRGKIANYKENIYESPIATSAGDVHFNYQTKNYFGHTRVEDLPENTGTRRVIEVQSDLYQKGRLESESSSANREISDEANLSKRNAEIKKLEQYSNPTAHFRMVREEVKQAALDGKTKLQFPTGETAMKIEGLGDPAVWKVSSDLKDLTVENGKVGMEVQRSLDGDTRTDGQVWIITDVLGEGKFKAVPKDALPRKFEYMQNDKTRYETRGGTVELHDGKYTLEDWIKDHQGNYAETFDISGKVDTNNPIYKFYEKDLGKYLKSKYGAELVTDKQGVKWWEVPIKEEHGQGPVTAFKRSAPKGQTITHEEAQKLIYKDIPKKDVRLIFDPDLKAREGLEGRYTATRPSMRDVLKPMIELQTNGGKVSVLTAFHESGHYIFDNFLTDAERAQAIADAKKEMGPMARARLTASGYDENELVEEYLMDKYADYKANEAGFKTSKIRAFLQKIDAIIQRIIDAVKQAKANFDAMPNKQGGFINFGDRDAEIKTVTDILDRVDGNTTGTFDKTPHVVTTLPEKIADVVGDKQVHLSDFVVAKVKGLISTIKGHPEVTNDMFAKIPDNLSDPSKILSDPRTDGRTKYLFLGDNPTHQIVVELYRPESGKTEINTIIPMGDRSIKQLESNKALQAVYSRTGGAVNPSSSFSQQGRLSGVSTDKDTIPPMRQEGKKGGKTKATIANEIKSGLSPQSASPEAQKAADLVRQANAEIANKAALESFKEKDTAKFFDKLSEEDNIKNISSYERTGKFEKAPDGYSEFYKESTDNAHAVLQAVYGEDRVGYVENYIRRQYEFGSEEDQKEGVKILTNYKKSMSANKSVLKGRTLDMPLQEALETMKAKGIDVKPVTTNPEMLRQWTVENARRAATYANTWTRLKDANLITFVKAGGKIPDDLVKLEDRVAEVMYPTDKGMVKTGQYFADKNVARILNNVVSSGLENSPTYKGIRSLSNAINQFQLGFSAFHLTGTAINAGISDMALGIRDLFSGRIATGAQEIGRGLIPGSSFVRDAIAGNRLIEGLKSGNPTAQAFLKDKLNPAGGRLGIDQRYTNDMATKMMKAFKTKTVIGGIKGAVRLPFAIVEAASKPLLTYAIPRVKIGAFMDLAENIAVRMPHATTAELNRAYAQAWDSIDNRFGQLVYDNLFWNKTGKDLVMLGTRSVGWNLGTVRELGGGVADAAKSLKGKPITDRTLYAIMLPIYAGMIGALYMYLHTGHGPKEVKDYFYPENGLTDKNGNPQRTTLPTYMKDVYAYSQDPLQTIENKTSPLISMAFELAQNKDYYGDMIRNPSDNVAKQLEQVGSFALNETAPFSVSQAIMTFKETGHLNEQSVENFFGFTNAPASVTKSDAQKELLNIILGSKGGFAPRTPEQVAAGTVHQQAETLYDQLKLLPKDDANAQVATLKTSNPSLYSTLKSVVSDAKLGVTYTDRLIKQLGVQNGDRAKYIYEQALKLPTSDARNAYIKDLIDKKVVSDAVKEQLKKLIQGQ